MWWNIEVSAPNCKIFLYKNYIWANSFAISCINLYDDKKLKIKSHEIIVGKDRDDLIEDLHKMIDEKDKEIAALQMKLQLCVCQPISKGYRGGELENLSERQLRRVTKPLVKVWS